MQRNFRSNYLKTLGIRGVQVKAPVEEILKEDVIDTEKLAKLCANYGVPAVHRVHIWKLLLGIDARHCQGQEEIANQRREQFKVLEHAAAILQGLGGEGTEGGQDQVDVILKMCLIQWRASTRIILNTETNAALSPIREVVRFFSELCDDPVDSYWLAERFMTTSALNLFLAKPTGAQLRMKTLTSLLVTVAAKEDKQLVEHLQRIRAQFDIIAEGWFLSNFANVFSMTSLERVLDRVIGSKSAGHSLVLACMGTAILVYSRHTLLAMNEAAPVHNFLCKLPNVQIDRLLGIYQRIYERNSES